MEETLNDASHPSLLHPDAATRDETRRLDETSTFATAAPPRVPGEAREARAFANTGLRMPSKSSAKRRSRQHSTRPLRQAPGRIGGNSTSAVADDMTTRPAIYKLTNAQVQAITKAIGKKRGPKEYNRNNLEAAVNIALETYRQGLFTADEGGGELCKPWTWEELGVKRTSAVHKKVYDYAKRLLDLHDDVWTRLLGHIPCDQHALGSVPIEAHPAHQAQDIPNDTNPRVLEADGPPELQTPLRTYLNTDMLCSYSCGGSGAGSSTAS